MKNSENIKVTLHWSEDNFIEGAKLLYDYTLKHSKKRILGWIFIAILQFGIVMVIKHNTIGMLLLGSFLSFYWYFLRWPLRKKALLMQFRKAPMANKDMIIEIDNNSLKVDNQELPFSDISEVIKSPQGYLLVIANGFIYIPFKSMSEKSKKRLYTIFKENIGIKSVTR